MARQRKRSASPTPQAGAKPAKKGKKKGKKGPAQFIHDMMLQKYIVGKVTPNAAISLKAALDYLTSELIELSANVAKSRTSGEDVKVTLSDLLEAIESDCQLKELIVKAKELKLDAEKS